MTTTRRQRQQGGCPWFNTLQKGGDPISSYELMGASGGIG